MLYGLSNIRHYQLKEMIRKLYQIHKEKNSRNFLVSTEAFSYLFNEKEIENKVKNGLLLISKDLEETYKFPVINIRPKSLFTKNFVNVPPNIEEEFIKKFGSYSNKVDKVTSRVIPSTNNKNGDITVYNTGSIYEMNMAVLWEKSFNHLTFAQFKRSFFEGELFKFENDEKISARINLILHYNGEFEILSNQLKEYIKIVSRIFSKFKNRGEVFTKAQFREAFITKFDSVIKNKDLPNVLLDMFVADVSQNSGFNQNSNQLKFIQERKAHNRDEMVYRVMNSNFTMLTSYLSRHIAQSKPNVSKSTFSTYIAVNKGKRQPDILYLAVFLELFGLASYEIIGGKNTEIFIRMNDPSKLRRLSQSNYKNGILSNIERRRNRSHKVLTGFMKANFDDQERWDLIEDYFLGRDEKVFQLLGISE